MESNIPLHSWGQEGLLWNRSWGGFSEDRGASVWVNGSSIYTCGYTGSFGAGGSDLALIKWNGTSGSQIWNRTWGGLSNDKGTSVWGNGSSIFTCGSTSSFGAGGDDLVLVKWDASGNQQWNNTWGGVSTDQGTAVWSDNAFVFTCGRTINYGAGDWDLMLIKWDFVSGAQIWNCTWGGSNTEYAYSIWGDSTGNIFGCGITNSYGTGGDLFLVKWNATSDQQWNCTWGGSDTDRANSVFGDDTGSIYTCGETYSYGVGSSDIFLVKWNATTSSQIWNCTWGGGDAEQGSSVWSDGAGAIFCCGTTSSFGAGGSDLVVIKRDALTGAQIWNRTWGGKVMEEGYSVSGDAAGAIYTAGYTRSYGMNSEDLLIIKWNTLFILSSDFIANATLLIDNGVVQFNFTGTDGDGIINYQWDFGDGSANATARNPVHHYLLTGNYTVELTVVDFDDVAVERKLQYITVEADLFPIANFSINTTEAPLYGWIQFTFTGFTGNAPATFTWDFDDETIDSVETNPKHRFNAPGVHNVSLTIIDVNGDMNTSWMTIDVIDPLVEERQLVILVILVLTCVLGIFIAFSINRVVKRRKIQNLRFKAYAGGDPYIFVSYSHKDFSRVYPLIDQLNKKGYRIWYDEGILVSTEFHNMIAQKIQQCSLFIVFISNDAMDSRYVQDEIHFAVNNNRDLVAVYLEKMMIPEGLRMRIERYQAILKYEMDEEQFMEQLEKTPVINKCLSAKPGVGNEIDELDAQFKKWDLGDSTKGGKI